MSNTVAKNKTAAVGKYSYKYVDIAQIHEYLESKGWSYYQYIDRVGEDDYIMTVRIIDGKEQTPLRGCRIVDAKLNGVVNPAQEQGSAITYARRYSLLLAFGLATEDDDAQSLSRRPRQPNESVLMKKANLKSMCDPNQWNLLQQKFGLPETWDESLVDKLIKQMKERTNE